MTHAYRDDPQGSIEDFIRGRFGAVEIRSIQVDEDFDRDGLPVFNITIMVEGTPSEIARKEPPGFLSKLRAHVEDVYHAFPVVRFRSAGFQGA
ncbi:hypothetical protein ABID82_002350 [Methylobacterium sp. PvP062]|uniref:Uncharacterized protein n=1 Tax=Methylobacterium radiotolerans TaxID=31998 RepID=A0ABV2NN79_9HYPH|nr:MULTISPECIES: hypothetical protein [unclassified Methylobacterium]MBP2495318.1 hypothetical protein [Methylobacterium sp. PvP105]MBP2504811.1 hypothetical protein [Methylobacterium sp. PvP109]MCX7335818.1 hypothetical protein [Hyphomicrobiales bacterium]